MGFICDVVDDVVDWVKDHIKEILIGIGVVIVAIILLQPELIAIGIEAVAGTVSAIVSSLGIAETGAIVTTLNSMNLLTVTSLTVWSEVGTFISTISMGFSAFLEAIHFKTLISIHEIAYLVSDEYRGFIMDVTSQVSEFSRSIGMGPAFAVLAIENARQLILDTSSMMGRRYDIGQVAWLKAMENMFSFVNKKSQVYADTPLQLLYDIDEWFNRPLTDSKAIIFETFYKNIDNLLATTAQTINQMVIIRDDFVKLVEDLPAKLKDEIKPFTDPITNGFDNFIRYNFQPNVEIFNLLIGNNKKKLDETRTELNNTVQRLKNPGIYLAEIIKFKMNDNDTAFTTNLDALEYINEYKRREELAVLAPEALRDVDQLEYLADALIGPTEEVSWFIPEQPKLSYPIDTKPKPKTTWFVGEY